MNSGIYLILNLNNGKVYVGSSKNLQSRKTTHWYDLRKGRHRNPHLQRAFSQDGEASFQWEVLIYCDEKELLYWEDWWMGRFDSRNASQGYNLLSADRRVVSDDTRRKISEANRGRKWTEANRAARAGWTLSAEAKARIGKATSAFLKGRPTGRKGMLLTEETKAKISASLTGKTHSEETKARMSLAQRGKVMSEEENARKSKRMMGHTVSEETKVKIAASLKGRPLSEETRLKLKGRIPWNKGIPMSEDQKAKLSATCKRLRSKVSS